MRYGLREDFRLFVPAVRAKFFASVSAVLSLVLDTSFLDCWTICSSFAFTRLVISRLSLVLGMFSPYEIVGSSLFEWWVLLPVLQKIDLLSDRRDSVVDKLGVRLEIDRKVRQHSSELLGMMFQLTCISAEYFDNRFQMFFHSRYSKETTPAAEIGAAGWYGCNGLVLPGSFDPLLSTFISGNESRFHGRLMYVDLLGARSLQDVPGVLDFTGGAVGNQQELAGLNRSFIPQNGVLRNAQTEQRGAENT